MARTARKAPEANSFVASAAKIGGGRGAKSFSEIAKSEEGWQREAWNFYHIIGEFRYACDWIGGMLSKALLYASVEKDGKRENIPSGAIANVVYDLFGDSDGRAEMLRLIGIHMTVTGEFNIVGYTETDELGYERDVWHVAAAGKVSRQGSTDDAKYIVNGVTLNVEPSEVIAFRVWRPDPLDPEKAISPARAVLTILGEIHRLTEHVAAQVDSRLAGAGIFLVPSEMQFPAPPPNADGTPRQANNAEDLMVLLQSTMAKAIENRGDAEALVPIVITAPADAIDKVQHMTFWTELDEHAIELRSEAIRRLALGMDMPPEVLTGTAESNHWNAWQADEAAIKSHTEPLLKIITTGLAQGYLRPALEALQDEGLIAEDENLMAYSINADTSEMRLRPNRSKEALELYNLGVLNKAALLRETGFDAEDSMGDDELALWLTGKVASGSTTPDLVNAALGKLGVKLDVPRETEEPADVGQEARPAPSLVDHPVQDIPDRHKSERRKEARERGDVPSAASNNAGLVAASEQVVIRAMERAGNKLKNKLQARPTVAAANLYRVVPTSVADYPALLNDAWGHVPTIAQRYGVDADWLERTLDSYCRSLFASKAEHSYEHFEDSLTFSLIELEATA